MFSSHPASTPTCCCTFEVPSRSLLLTIPHKTMPNHRAFTCFPKLMIITPPPGTVRSLKEQTGTKDKPAGNPQPCGLQSRTGLKLRIWTHLKQQRIICVRSDIITSSLLAALISRWLLTPVISVTLRKAQRPGHARLLLPISHQRARHSCHSRAFLCKLRFCIIWFSRSALGEQPLCPDAVT